MIYTVTEICIKINAKQERLRQLLCLAHFESRRIDGSCFKYRYDLSDSDLVLLKQLYEKKQSRRNIGGCKLTSREEEIYLLLVDKGLSFKQIANDLNIDIKTVRKDIDTICLKKRVSGNQRLIQLAVRYWRKKYRDEILSAR